MRPLFLLPAATALTACSTPPDWIKAGTSPDDYTRQTASCRVTGREIAPGTGAPAPSGLTTPQLAQFTDCMLAAGWKRGR